MEKGKTVGNIDHIAIAVRDMDKAIEFFSDLLDTEFMEVGSYEPTGFRSVMSPGGIELMCAIRPDADIQKFLDRRGEGVYAIAFTVQDADKAKAKAEKKGIRVVGDVSAEGAGGPLEGLREIWLHPKDCFGVYVMFTQGNPYHP